MKVLTFSRFYPAGHPKSGQPTLFIEQILNSILPRPLSVCLDEFPPAARYYINDFYVIDGTRQKHHTIRTGARFKPGDMASLRVWSGLPYRSKQIEFAQVEVKKTWIIRIEFSNDILWPYINGIKRTNAFECELARNDGLELQDFIDWFKGYPKKSSEVFAGQVICWNDKIKY